MEKKLNNPIQFSAADVIGISGNKALFGINSKVDSKDIGKYRMLGGFADPEKDGNISQTAEREFFEESGGGKIRNLRRFFEGVVDDPRFRESVHKIWTYAHEAEILNPEILPVKYSGIVSDTDDMESLHWVLLKDINEAWISENIITPHIPAVLEWYRSYENRRMIKEINESDMFGDFIEIGAGVPLASEIFKYPNASKTISKVTCAYSREAQESTWKLNSTYRAVSLERVKEILDQELQFRDEKSNLSVVTSFQIPEGGCAHGWIGISYKGKSNFYHLTIPEDFTEGSRERKISVIGDSLLRILHSQLRDIHLPNLQLFVDDSLDGKLMRNYKDLFRSKENSFMVFNPKNHSSTRLEDLFRGSEDALIYKGSFNPHHEGHKFVYNYSKGLLPYSPGALMLSVNTYGKGEISYSEIEKRVKDLNNLGYVVIVTQSGMYSENLKNLDSRIPDTTFHFAMGIDTYERMFPEDLLDFEKRGYLILCFQRGDDQKKEEFINLKTPDFVTKIINVPHPHISSTEIRAKLLQGS